MFNTIQHDFQCYSYLVYDTVGTSSFGKTSVQQLFRLFFNAKQCLCDWTQAKGFHNYANTDQEISTRISCSPLPQGFVKCNNINATFHVDINSTSWGICCRANQGNFKVAIFYSEGQFFPIAEREALGSLRALNWLLENHFCRVIFEMDSKLVVDKVYSMTQDFFELSVIIQECAYIFSLNPNYLIQFIKRQTNFVTHSIARVATDFASLSVTFLYSIVDHQWKFLNLLL